MAHGTHPHPAISMIGSKLLEWVLLEKGMPYDQSRNVRSRAAQPPQPHAMPFQGLLAPFLVSFSHFPHPSMACFCPLFLLCLIPSPPKTPRSLPSLTWSTSSTSSLPFRFNPRPPPLPCLPGSPPHSHSPGCPHPHPSAALSAWDYHPTSFSPADRDFRQAGSRPTICLGG